jgi:NAD+ dependent glucose-6-phosphate dehydrogenase
MSETHRRKVLITGAAGGIGQSLAASCRETYDLRLQVRRPEHPFEPERDVVIADITDLEATRPIAAGIDTIWHLAGDPNVPASWESVYANNILGVRNILEAARQASVRRVVFASTNHVMGKYDQDSAWPVYNDMPQRPDSLYGVSKAFGETIGRYYHDEYGLEFIALRIGWFMETPHMKSDVGRAMWLSPRDCAHAFQCATETDVPHGVYYAISNNPNRRWDITDAMIEIGYRPQDSWTDHVDPGEVIAAGERVHNSDWDADGFGVE